MRRILLVAVVAGATFTAGLAAARAGGQTPTDRTINCAVNQLPDPGTHVITMPGFCRLGMCRVQVSWEESFFGAFGPGIPLPAYVYQQSDGAWIGGPNLSLGGMTLSDGSGINGDGIAQAIYGGSRSEGGSSWAIYDDSEEESSHNLWSVVINEADSAAREVIGFTVYVCSSGNATTTNWG